MRNRAITRADTPNDLVIDAAGFEIENHGPEWIHRLLSRGTGLVTWLVLTAPIWAAFLIPAAWAVGFAIFCLYWLIQSCSIAVRAMHADRLLRCGMATDWRSQLAGLAGNGDLQHLIVLPTYREPFEVLAESLRALLLQDLPAEQINVVVSAEQRDPNASLVLDRIYQEFQGRFRRLLVTVHPDRPGEVAGKASNVNWAVRQASARLISEGLTVSQIMVTICDADSRLHSAYLSALSCLFLDPTPGVRGLYQPLHLPHGNLERVPAPLRLIAAVYSLMQIARLTRRHRYLQSTYSVPLALAARFGFWDVDVIPEDSHTTFKARFRAGPDATVVPVPVPVWGDVPEGRTAWEAFSNYYRQVRRWAWGVSDVPYALYHAVRAPVGERIDAMRHALLFAWEHLLWPTHWFLLTIGLNLIPLTPPDSSLAPILQASSLIGAIALACSWPVMVLSIWLDGRLRSLRNPPAPGPGLAWLLIPVVGLALFTLPSVDAHFRLLFGIKMHYQVTPKRRSGRPATEQAPLHSTLPTTEG